MRFESRMSDTRNSHHAVQQTSKELILLGIKRRPRSNIASAFNFHFRAAIFLSRKYLNSN
jgi:hypothetical protein